MVEWRRLDHLAFGPAAEVERVIPLHLTDPTSERKLSRSNVESSGIAIGGDEVGIKIFWDVF